MYSVAEAVLSQVGVGCIIGPAQGLGWQPGLCESMQARAWRRGVAARAFLEEGGGTQPSESQRVSIVDTIASLLGIPFQSCPMPAPAQVVPGSAFFNKAQNSVRAELVTTQQVPNFTKLGWVSAVGAVASLTYSTLAYVLAFLAGKQPAASYAPIPHDSPASSVFGAFNAIANIGGFPTRSHVVLH